MDLKTAVSVLNTFGWEDRTWEIGSAYGIEGLRGRIPFGIASEAVFISEPLAIEVAERILKDVRWAEPPDPAVKPAG